ncbi:MAG: hypothetical protein IPJ45_17570 [Ignavibacteria bacterium]|nr:hypothetical protein [Ignavibacteria bacterium]
MLSCYDLSRKPLTEKILDRPRLIGRIKKLITDSSSTHLTCYNITPLEKSLAVKLEFQYSELTLPSFMKVQSPAHGKLSELAELICLDGNEDLKTKEDIAASL